MPIVAAVAARNREAEACFKKSPHPSDAWCWTDRSDEWPPFAPPEAGTPGSMPPIDALIYETKNRSLEALGPARPKDNTRAVTRFGFQRLGPSGEATISILDAKRSAVRAIATELRPALDACMAALPKPQ
jgi:hypothetical protein